MFRTMLKTFVHSLAFLIYSLVVTLIRLWTTAGRNGSTSGSDGSIELTQTSKWYAPVPSGDVEGERHVIGEDE